jgi:hypothetical protein
MLAAAVADWLMKLPQLSTFERVPVQLLTKPLLHSCYLMQLHDLICVADSDVAVTRLPVA